MFSKKFSSLILLKSNSLDIYAENETRSLIFEDEQVKHLEILDRDKLDEALENFIEGLKPQEAVLLLSDTVIFQKTLGLNEEEGIEEFFDKLPFEKENIAKKKIKGDKQLFLFATNQQLYKAVVEAFVGRGWEINIVSPAALFPEIAEKDALTKTEVEQVLNSEDVLLKGNFIEGEEFVLSNQDNKEDVDNKDKGENESSYNATKIAVFGLVGIFLLSGLFFAAFRYRQKYIETKTTQSQQIIQESLSSPTPESASATPTINKEDLKIEILNGSSVSGLAAKIKVGLTELGFKNIATGNFDGNNLSETVATFSATVSAKDKNIVKGLLDDNFTKVIINEASRSAKYDIAIVTGTKLK